jgi:hypothetical protein
MPGDADAENKFRVEANGTHRNKVENIGNATFRYRRSKMALGVRWTQCRILHSGLSARREFLEPKPLRPPAEATAGLLSISR